MITKIAVVGGSFSYAKPFEEHGSIHTVYDAADVYDLEPDVLVFTGGEDVDPYLYNEQPHPATCYNVSRDKREAEVFEAGVSIGAKMCGICRGSQFLTVRNGAKLVQHIYGHGIHGTHPLRNLAGEELASITSTHHQMMYPYVLDEGDYEIIAIADSHGMEGVPEGCAEPDHVVEAVWYPNTQCLGVQGHPEYMKETSSGWQWYQKLLAQYIFNE